MISEIFSSESLAAMSLERLSQLERLVRKTKAEFKKLAEKGKLRHLHLLGYSRSLNLARENEALYVAPLFAFSFKAPVSYTGAAWYSTLVEHVLGIDLISLIEAAGYLGLFSIIFAESGIFLGFFLPGDSLIFTAGFLASQGYFSIWILAPLLFAAATLGDSFGYWFGRRMGERLYAWEDSWYFKKEYLDRTEHFYEDHGKFTIIVARFIPIVRTFAPILAGAGHMRYRTFISYNVVGALIWAVGMVFLGYLFGSLIPNPDAYLLPIVGAIILTSFVPVFVKLWKSRHKK